MVVTSLVAGLAVLVLFFRFNNLGVVFFSGESFVLWFIVTWFVMLSSSIIILRSVFGSWLLVCICAALILGFLFAAKILVSIVSFSACDRWLFIKVFKLGMLINHTFWRLIYYINFHPLKPTRLLPTRLIQLILTSAFFNHILYRC